MICLRMVEGKFLLELVTGHDTDIGVAELCLDLMHVCFKISDRGQRFWVQVAPYLPF